MEGTVNVQRSGVSGATAQLSMTGAGPTVNASAGYHPLIVQSNGSEKLRVDSSGNLLVGTSSDGGDGISLRPRVSGSNTTSQIRFNRADTTSSGIAVLFQNNSSTVGQIVYTNSGTLYITSSDERLKENIQDAKDAGSKIDAIKVRQFDWKADGSHQDYGVIAQELAEVAPEAVTEGETEDDMLGVDYSKLVPTLIKEIQTLRNRVAQLEE